MTTTRRSFLATAAYAPLFAAALDAAEAQASKSGAERLFYLGTYTGNDSGSKGIYAFRFQASTGRVTAIGLAAETDSPSFLVVHPNRRFLYAVNESAEPGATAFGIDAASGKLTRINKVKTGGLSPAHLAVDPTGKWVIVGNYGNGEGTEGTSVAVFGVKADGGLDEKPKAFVAHKAPAHPHCVLLSPDNKFLLVADKGQNRIVVYRFNTATGALTPNDPPYIEAPTPGAEPRHVAFGRGGRFLYASQEAGRSVAAYAFDPARGALKSIGALSTLPPGAPATGNTSEIEVHPDGAFLYVANRGHDSLALFAIDAVKGTLQFKGTTPTGGHTPRHFEIDPTGDFLFAENQESNTTTLFKIDRKTGALTPAGVTLKTPSPVCIAFV